MAVSIIFAINVTDHAQNNATDSPSPGPGRCFPFWQEVLACYVVNTNGDDESGKKKCVPVLEDYYECMHHKKEVSLVPAPTTEAKGTRAHALRTVGRSSGGTTGSIQKSRVETRTRGCTNSRADTEFGAVKQGGGYKESVGLKFIDAQDGTSPFMQMTPTDDSKIEAGFFILHKRHLDFVMIAGVALHLDAKSLHGCQ